MRERQLSHRTTRSIKENREKRVTPKRRPRETAESMAATPGKGLSAMATVPSAPGIKTC